ncbi:hypothetical protein INT43_008772 [Umbelopsis isabellina]|uniref:RING-type domain-containing protein n=1 Tax=Mortierella isabellina TaxID=91625 RepID=A0A8H7UFK4_MORIS|nr:hypothetical protein INT43_008772 [Umbelopsis isabellina]
MAGHEASSVLEIEPESQVATAGSSDHSISTSLPDVSSQAAAQNLGAATSLSPTDTRAQSSILLESLSPSNAVAITTRTVNTTSRTVRWNWVNYLRDRWRTITSSNKMLLIFTLFLSTVQIVTSIIAIAISDDGVCERPLKIFLIVYTVRVILSFPFSVYQYLHPRRRRRTTRRRRGQTLRPAQIPQSPTATPGGNQDRRPPLSEAASAQNTSPTSPSTSITAISPADTTPTADNNAHSRRDFIIGARVDRAKSLLDLFATFWFVVGNYFLFGSTSCASSANILFYVTLAWVVLGYIMITIPIIFCAAAIFCLPCVLGESVISKAISDVKNVLFKPLLLVGLRIMQVGEPSEIGGASPEEIKKIPVLRFTADPNETSSIAESHISIRSAVPQRSEQHPRVGFFRRVLLKKTRKAKSQPDSQPPKSKEEYQSISFDNSEDAVCAICLSNYEQDELVCRLWCQHHFHKDCLHEWLALNSMCPMCKQDSRGKEYELVEVEEA